MHIEPSTHEQSHSAKVYSYEADFDVSGGVITWRALVHHADEPASQMEGEIPITSPALPAYAAKAVRDAIMQRIDGFGSTGSGGAASRAPVLQGAQAATQRKPAASRAERTGHAKAKR